MRHEDNLRLEGKFEGKQVESVALRGERAQIKRHEDNLHMEGSFEGRRSGGAVLAGERAQVVRHQDNLRVEGKFEGRQQQQVRVQKHPKLFPVLPFVSNGTLAKLILTLGQKYFVISFRIGQFCVCESSTLI